MPHLTALNMQSRSRPIMARIPQQLLLVAAILVCSAWPACAQRSLKQANAPVIAPKAKRGAEVPLPEVPATNFKVLARAAPAVNTENGAYIGCFDVTKMVGVAWDTQKKLDKVTGCRKYCEDRFFAFTIIKGYGACICSMEIPKESNRLANSVCDSRSNSNAVAVFYNHYYANTKACRILDVPMEQNSFRWAYNQDKTSFNNGVMTIRMDGSSGARLYYPVALEYGLVEVNAQVSGVSGVVSAFYTRSDTMQETSDFSEIDFEFLNGNPGVPGSIWTNSFKGGVSFGERMIPPSSYKNTLSTTSSVADTFYNFKIHWQPNQVSWIVNNRVLRRNYYDQQVEWCDMVGKCTKKAFRPPTKPSYPTFSMWHDTDNGGSFGGQLGPGSPYSSQFKGLRLVVCDQPLTNYNGPAWTFGGSTAPPSGGGGTPPPPGPTPAPPPTPAPGPAPIPTPPPSCTAVAGWAQCGGSGGECTSKPGGTCKDAQWTGYCCVSGYKCTRRDAYYWQCVQ